MATAPGPPMPTAGCLLAQRRPRRPPPRLQMPHQEGAQARAAAKRMQTSGRGFYGFGAKEEDKMEELEEPRGATFLWLCLPQSAPEIAFFEAPEPELPVTPPFGRAPAGAGFGADHGALPNGALICREKFSRSVFY